VHRFLRGFRPKVRIQFEKGSFIVKTVENWSELEQVLRLRHEVFHREFLNKRLPLGMDMDRFDPVGDHLVIVDKESGKIVGTYRLISSAYSNVFYSQSEFDLDAFLKLPGIKLELSRACIHRDYRDGIVIALLWRGLVQYIQQVKAAYLFGCASIRSMDGVEVGSIYRYLSSKSFLSAEFRIEPVGSYRMPGFYDTLGRIPEGNAEIAERGKALIPPLLNSYLKAGAKVCGAPALDVSFQCVDFLTVLRMEDLTRLFERKYTPNA
jgi:putative hemolysin